MSECRYCWVASSSRSSLGTRRRPAPTVERRDVLCSFDALGRPVGHLERRTIAITWDQMAAIPTVVAVAAGPTKIDAIAGALETGCVGVLVTDEPTAHGLLKEE